MPVAQHLTETKFGMLLLTMTGWHHHLLLTMTGWFTSIIFFCFHDDDDDAQQHTAYVMLQHIGLNRAAVLPCSVTAHRVIDFTATDSVQWDSVTKWKRVMPPTYGPFLIRHPFTVRSRRPLLS